MKIELTLEEALSRCGSALASKIQYSIELIRKAESLALRYHPDGFYLAFSGGKDSQALMHIAQLAGVKFTSHFSPTTVDPPELLRFIRRNYPEVQFNKPPHSIYQEFLNRKCLPSMRIRWCCKVFKETGGEGRVTLVGVRNGESAKRAKRKEVEVTNHKYSGDIEGFNDWSAEKIAKKKRTQQRKKKDTQFDQFSHHEEQMVTCVGGNDKIVVSPIIHWSDEDVWEFLNKVVRVPHCELYDEGWTRIGCICCPMATTKNMIRDTQRWPHVKEKWIKAIMRIRKNAMTENTPPNQSTIPTPKFSYAGGVETYHRSTRSVWAKLPYRKQSPIWGGSKGIDKILPPPTT